MQFKNKKKIYVIIILFKQTHIFYYIFYSQELKIRHLITVEKFNPLYRKDWTAAESVGFVH